MQMNAQLLLLAIQCSARPGGARSSEALRVRTIRGSTTKFIYLGDVCTSIIKSIALFFASLLVPVSYNTQQKLLLLLLQLVVTTMTAAAIHAKAPTDSQIHHPGQFGVAATIVEWS